MKIAFAIRPDYLENRGGDTFQMLKTKQYLEKIYGCKVSVITSAEELSKEQFDLLHIFNLQTADFTLKVAEEAKKYKIKVFLSPIMWYLGGARYVNRMSRITCNFSVISSFRWMSHLSEKMCIKEEYRTKKKILEMCDAILPNSIEEEEIVKRLYKVNLPSYVIPNCVDLKLDEERTELSLPSNFVLEVGRIEPTKNQLAVILAMMNHREIPLYFIGQQNPVKKHYIEYVKKLAKIRGNTYFLTDLPQEQLVSYYKAAKVHVLPSFRESPGLVTLEALYYKTNVVVSKSEYCPISYYQLDEYGFVCDPFSIKSIEKAIMSAYEEDVRKVPNEYFNFIHYKNAAKLTHKAYMSNLKQ